MTQATTICGRRTKNGSIQNRRIGDATRELSKFGPEIVTKTRIGRSALRCVTVGETPTPRRSIAGLIYKGGIRDSRAEPSPIPCIHTC